MPRPKKPKPRTGRKPMPRKTTSQRVRELHAQHPEFTGVQLAKYFGCSRQLVAKALAADPTNRGGRKPDPAARVARLRRELADAERELASSEGAPTTGRGGR